MALVGPGGAGLPPRRVDSETSDTDQGGETLTSIDEGHFERLLESAALYHDSTARDTLLLFMERVDVDAAIDRVRRSIS